jgi:hypothetical protein
VHVPLPAFKANLLAFVRTLLDHVHAERILLITPPPINVHKFRSRTASHPAPSAAPAVAPPAAATDADVAAAATEAVLALGVAADQGHAPFDDGSAIAHAPSEESADAAGVREARRELGPRVYARKMLYAAAVLDLAGELADPRVACADVWHAVVQRGLQASGRAPLPAGESCVHRPWEAMVRWRLPGCGLPLAEEFAEGFFEDRLHFGTAGYRVVGEAVWESIGEHWPELLES